jgi:uncharacterized membrane protein
LSTYDNPYTFISQFCHNHIFNLSLIIFIKDKQGGFVVNISIPLIISFILLIISFFLNILGLMEMFPLLISAPLLFISIFVTLYLVNHRKTFRGF